MGRALAREVQIDAVTTRLIGSDARTSKISSLDKGERTQSKDSLPALS